jgi:hypothetical protein
MVQRIENTFPDVVDRTLKAEGVEYTEDVAKRVSEAILEGFEDDGHALEHMEHAEGIITGACAFTPRGFGFSVDALRTAVRIRRGGLRKGDRVRVYRMVFKEQDSERGTLIASVTHSTFNWNHLVYEWCEPFEAIITGWVTIRLVGDDNPTFRVWKVQPAHTDRWLKPRLVREVDVEILNL